MYPIVLQRYAKCQYKARKLIIMFYLSLFR